MSDQASSATVGVLDQFQSELVDAWQRVPNKGFFLVLLVAWLALFQFLGNSILGYVDTHSLFAWLNESYNSPNEVSQNDAHGNFIPFLVLGLLWWKRKDWLEAQLRLWLPALAIVLVAILVHVMGYSLQVPQISVVALFLGIYGLTGLAWGPQWLVRTFFPFFLFAFSVPLGNHTDFITFRLRLLVCQLVEFICRDLLVIPVLREGTMLFDATRTYQYDVAAPCSGIRSLIAIFLLSTSYAFIVFRPWWKRILLILMTFPFAVLGNLIRMLCIILAAEIGGQSAGNYVHESGFFSLLPYVPAILGVFLLGHWLGDRKSNRAESKNTESEITAT